MHSETTGSEWKGLLEEEWLRRLDQTLFLTRCREGGVTRAELRSFVRQHYHYARHFTRYLCALLSNLVDEADRFELAHNLFEEMGFGGLGSVPHVQIYREMMARMEVRAETEPVFPETLRLIEEMLDCCRNPDPAVGLGALCLGAEAIVPHLYRQIVEGFRSQAEPEENLEFFRIHIEEDDKHASTMRRIIERLAHKPEARARIREIARKMLSARARFFEGLIPEKGVTHANI